MGMTTFDPDDFTHFADRAALAPVLDAAGVVSVTVADEARIWQFTDGMIVEERATKSVTDRVHALAAALAAEIHTADVSDEDVAFGVRLALADVLTAARQRVPEEWEFVALHQIGKLLAEAGIYRAKARVDSDTGQFTLTVTPDSFEPDSRLQIAWGKPISRPA